MAKKVKKKEASKEEIMMCQGLTSDGQNANRVFVSIGKTINIGNYESFRVDIGMGREVRKGENFNDVKYLIKQQVLKDALTFIGTVEKSLKS